MHIFMPEIEITQEEGFSNDKDIFERKKFGEGLTNILTSVEDPMVLVLDAPWGTGKSTFVKMWAGEMRKSDNLPVIYFDAFANDHLGDAFISLAGEVVSLAREKELEQISQYEKFSETAIRVGKRVGKKGLSWAARAASCGYITENDVEDLTNTIREFKKESCSWDDSYIWDKIESHAKEKEIFKEFRSALSGLAEALSNDNHESPTDGNLGKHIPLIIIIDELDRCRPPFALEVLENIKHYFSTQHVHFVLVTHLKQLADSVRHEYGVSDADLYLQKFYHYSASFPKVGNSPHEGIASRYIQHVMSSLPDDKEGNRLKQNFSDDLQRIAQEKEFSLRTVERICTVLGLLLAFTNEKFFRPYPILPYLCIIKIDQPEMYEKARNKQLSFEEIKQYFDFKENSDESYTDSDYWQFCLLEESKLPKRDWSAYLPHQYNIRDRKEILPILIEKVLERFTLPD